MFSLNAIYAKEKHNVGFFIFKFALKYMLRNVYVYTLILCCLYINSLAFNFFVVSKGILHF